MEIRTDLAIEAEGLESVLERAGGGVKVRRERKYGSEATVVEIRNRAGERALGKPKGTYITIELDQVLLRQRDSFRQAAECIGAYLEELLALSNHLPVLVAGLGNREITPDAIGPLTTDHILVTRHMLEKMPETFGRFRPVSAFSPGVLGTTGMETAEMVRAVARHAEAAAVIAVDAIAARDTKLLCGTVQLSNTGITPGSGIGNHRNAIDETTVGMPVIAVGVPTVTDAPTMAADLLGEAGMEEAEHFVRNHVGGMIVTTGDIDRRIREISRVLAFGINIALHRNLDFQDLEDLTF